MIRNLLWIAGVLIIALVLLPILGMGFAYNHPPGLFEPPPMPWERIGKLIFSTLALSALVSGLSLVFGTLLAIAGTRYDYWGRRILTPLSILPLAVPSYLLATIVRESLAPNGSIGSWLGTESSFSGFWAAVVVLTVSCTPYVHALVGAAMAQFPAGEEEAARSLGASPWRRFRAILLPRLRPTWAFSLVLVALYVLSDFGAVAVLNCPVLTWELYLAVDTSLADAVVLATAIMACVIPLLAVIRLLAGKDGAQRRLGRGRVMERAPLRGWGKVGIYLLHAAMVGIGVLLPVFTLIGWVHDGITYEAPFAPITGPLVNTALYTFLGTVLTLVLALVPAWIVARMAGRKSGAFLENATYLTSSIPGILVAVGILHLLLGLKRTLPIEWEGNSMWDGIEAAGIFLLLGYAMRFLAEGYAALKPAILGLDTRQEESARSLGASPSKRFFRVTLPLLGPGIGAAFLLLFLSIAKELPVTLMLAPLGEQTLAYRVFDAQQEASFPDVGVSGLILLLFAVAMQWAITRWRKDG